MNRLWLPLLTVLVLAHLALGQPSPPPPTPVPIHAQAFIPLEQPPWADGLGHPALAFTNLNTIPSWDYLETCLSIDTNVPAFLQEPVYESGRTNLTFATGSISVWFQPNWTSVIDGGSGPTNWATLLSIGHWTSNAAQSAWTIALSPAGTNLVMEAQSDGSNQVVFDAPIDFDAGDWHALTLSYTPTNCALYLEGEPVTNTAPINNYPSESDCAEYGLFVGSMSADGFDQCHGQLQWLTTYATALTAGQVAANYAEVSEYIAFFGGSLPSVGGFHPDLGSPPDPGGGWGTNSGGTNGGPQLIVMNWPSPVSPTNYAAYNQFCLNITNDATNAYVSVTNTLSNLTYAILTNGYLANPNGWGLWQVVWASNSITPAPPIPLVSNAPLFFNAMLIAQTGTNGLDDAWCMKYFGTLNVDPYADPDGDGLCNLDEYLLGTNPTNAYSKTSLHTDAQALLLAFTNYDSNCTYQLSVTNAGTNTVLVTMSPTLVGSNYQIYTHNQSDTNNTWIVETSFLGTNSSTTVAITLNGRSLDFVGGYGEDSDGDGLPDGYEVISSLTDPYLPDTGITGISDGYKDPDGDGYSNLEEMYNGTNPHVFNTPAGPQNLVTYNDTATNFTLSWEAAAGPVLGYVISIDIGGVWSNVATNSAFQLSFVVNAAPTNVVVAQVQALYAQGLSTGDNIYTVLLINGYNPMATIAYQPSYTAPCAIVNGPGGHRYLVLSQMLPNLSSILVTCWAYSIPYPWDDSPGSHDGIPYSQRYVQPQTYYPSFPDGEPLFNFTIPVSQLTNGVGQISDSDLPLYGYYLCYAQEVASNGNTGDFGVSSDCYATPFIDATTQMKQNLAFLLRIANDQPLHYNLSFAGGTAEYEYPTNYVYSDFYFCDGTGFEGTGYAPYRNPYEAIEDNYFYNNLVFQTDLIDSDGNLQTGFSPVNGTYANGTYYAGPDVSFMFPTYDYITASNGMSVPGLLAPSDTEWVGYLSGGYDIFELGGYNAGGSWGMSNYANLYGLPYDSLELTLTNGTQATLSPGNNVSGWNLGSIYEGTAQPQLKTVGFYFARIEDSLQNSYVDYNPLPNGDPLPGFQNGSFTPNVATVPLILGAVGRQMTIAGYAKQAATNGNTNVFAYLGQYFTNAFVMSNGVVTTNSAGILSEYGEFFPTVPGHVGLQTMPDPDQTNIQGTCEVDIIRLSLDVNHDGTMDESYTGPDNTGSGIPYVFWANNDYDRWDIDLIDSATTGGPFYQEDSVASNSIYALSPYTGDYVADCDYQDSSGNRAIPCPRDLEDFARLWVSGVSNTLSRLPSGSTVTLNWGDVGSPDTNNPTIDLFQAADADGGVGYLTNLTTASNQINNALCRYVGRIGPGSNLLLNDLTYSNGWPGDHYIWCGVGYGSGTLSLTISDGSGNVLAQSSQSVQIVDIKQMYERWTVGDAPGSAPQNVAVRANDSLPPGVNQPFQYSYDPNYDTNDTYILNVHGYNITLWESERFSETAYKRLYWQGYTGRFGAFRWPCSSSFLFFDTDEQTSWESGTGLYHLLVRLNSYYPGKVYLFAHSLGNVAAGQALLMAGTNTLVNTYIAAQGAVAAHTYDPITTNRTPTYPLVFTTPDRYAQYWTNGAPCYFNGVAGAGSYINFFNTNDWALTVAWEPNQDLKPDKTFSPYEKYAYNGSNFLFETTFPTIGSSIITGSQVLSFPTNTFTIYAHCDQAPCMALGAQTNVGGVFKVGVTYQQVDLAAAPYNFAKLHIYHSGEFRSDNMQRWQFWNQVLNSYGLK